MPVTVGPLQFNVDFLEPLKYDIPRGSWVTRFDPVTKCVTLRSLMWPGKHL
ncbi:hypothetical protein, conserved [Eimeria necatrix]|uniref:Uncharacterized protein n=1 Tax=Eimeria necatrix TaxID=51315 RepID=U6MVT4_9EIME|nr:hypothetical protein, conserved [Eimeria necatrix]CDJ68382.1 hypothetical protein, conserved [Eimeria necatrix]